MSGANFRACLSLKTALDQEYVMNMLGLVFDTVPQGTHDVGL